MKQRLGRGLWGGERDPSPFPCAGKALKELLGIPHPPEELRGGNGSAKRSEAADGECPVLCY